MPKPRRAIIPSRATGGPVPAGAPERERGDDDPLQQRRESDLEPEDRRDGHEVGIGPRLPDLDVQPFEEHGGPDAEQRREDGHGPEAAGRPVPVARDDPRDGECGHREHHVAHGAVDDGGRVLAGHAVAPDRVKGQVAGGATGATGAPRFSAAQPRRP